MTHVSIAKEDLLDLLNVAEDYGFGRSMFYYAVVGWHGPITTAEIQHFADSFIDESGYGPEDVEAAYEAVHEIFKTYGEIKDVV